MVTELGMSEKLGTIKYSNDSQEVFLGHSVTQTKNMSDATAQMLDEEVKSLVDEAIVKCRKILSDKIEDLHKVAKGLMEYETLTLAEVKDLIKGVPPLRDDFDNNSDLKQTTPTQSAPKTGKTVSPQTQ